MKSFPVLRSSSKFYAYFNATLTKLNRLFLDNFVEFRWKRGAIGKSRFEQIVLKVEVTSRLKHQLELMKALLTSLSKIT